MLSCATARGDPAWQGGWTRPSPEVPPWHAGISLQLCTEPLHLLPIRAAELKVPHRPLAPFSPQPSSAEARPKREPYDSRGLSLPGSKRRRPWEELPPPKANNTAL